MIETIIKNTFKYKQLVLILLVGICIGGALSLKDMAIDAFPDISPNLVQVFAEVDGTAVEEVEQFVSRPIELTMMGILGVKKIRSVSSYGLATVNIYFEDDMDIYLAHNLVDERLAHAAEDIPKEFNLPHGIEKGPIVNGMGKVLSYYIDGDGYSTAELRTLQDWVVKRHLLTVPGVADVISQGGYVRQYQVRINPEKLLAYDLSLDEVTEAIQKNNMNLGAGIMARGSEELIVRSIGLIKSMDDLKRIVVRTHQGKPVYVSDVAQVAIGNAFRRGVASLNGEKEVAIGGIYKLHGANSFEVIKGLKAKIEGINKTLPPGVKVTVCYDQSTLVGKTIGTVRNALALGLAFVCVVAFLFLGSFRNVLIMVFSLPFSMMLTFMVMHMAGMPGDLISFGGVAIALGMIIDATIIMVEKVQSAISGDAGEKSIPEIIVATGREVGQPIFFAVSIIIIVFIPIFTLQGVEGKMFRPLAFTVTVTMLGSLVYALIIAPTLYGMLHRKKRKESRADGPSRMHRSYRSFLSGVLKMRGPVIAAMIIVMALGVVVFVMLGREFVPTLQEGNIQLLAHMDPNISLAEITKLSKKIEKDIIKVPEVRYVLSDIGYGEVGPHIHHTNYGCITVVLKPKSEWTDAATQQDIVHKIEHEIGRYPGVSFSFSQPIQHEVDDLIAGAGTQVVAKLFGPDMDVLSSKIKEVEHVLADITGVADLRHEQFAGQTQLQITMNGEAIARHGINRHDIQTLARNAIGGENIGTVLEGERSFDINIRFAEAYRSDFEAIRNLLVRTPKGYSVPLAQLATVATKTGLRRISRENSHRYISLQCNVRGRDAGGFVAEAQAQVAARVKLPPGYSIAWGGQFELQQAANRRLAIVMPVTLLLVLILLYGLFHSYKNVLLIMCNIPLALVGGVFALGLAGGHISIPSSIGFIALFGIALTDGLVLISRIEHLRRNGQALKDAVIEGAVSKLRPVVMTTVTTALGLLPLILSGGIGSEVQRPLAIVVVGGLTSSTLLTLIVLPVLYYSFTPRNEVSDAM